MMNTMNNTRVEMDINEMAQVNGGAMERMERMSSLDFVDSQMSMASMERVDSSFAMAGRIFDNAVI